VKPYDPSRPSLDPVQIARERGPETLSMLLRDYGRYVPQQRPLVALNKSLKDEHPLLMEGERGAGKTAMPEALAEACNIPLFFFPCMDGVTVEEMLSAWDSTVQSQHVLQQLAAGVPRQQAQQEQWTLDFLNFGEIGAAYHYASQSNVRCVLCVDEVDKLDNRRQDALLQVTARGYFDVPRLRPDSRIGSFKRLDGSVPFLPLVFFTSNNMRGGVSSPLRSRCYYSYINYPTDIEQVAILRVQVPDAPPALSVQVVKMITYIRSMTIDEKPALREMIDLTKSLVRDGIKYMTRPLIEESLCVIAKLPNDESNIGDRMTTIEEIVLSREPEIEEMVARVYGCEMSALAPPAGLRLPPPAPLTSERRV
jgi:MoxR-like ATPase